MIKSVVSTLIFFMAANAFAQRKNDPAMLIPYNDHGKWGYCDTLGNIKIEPQFESASFFSESNSAGNFSFVRRGEESVYYALDKGCVAPIGCKADYSFFRFFFSSNDLAVIKKNGKVGLFNYGTQRVVVDAIYTQTMSDEENGMIYFSREDEKSENMNILAYDVNAEVKKKLKYIEIATKGTVNSSGEVQEYILFRDKRNRWFELIHGEWTKFPYSDYKFDGDFEDYYVRESAPMPKPIKKLYSQVSSYRISKVEGATLHSSIEIGNYRDYQVMWKGGYFGLYKEASQLLPFSYDFIDIDYEQGFFYLLRDKKMGGYLPKTSYSVIEPKYDLLSLYKKIKVNEKWSFVLFTAKMNGFDGYVGENGVEYFNFD